MNDHYRIGEWLLRPQHDHIERGDEIVHIQPKPMAVLKTLVHAGNEIVTRNEIFEAVWPGQEVSDAALTQCIVELRHAFGDSAHDPKVIRTVPKVGFCLMPPVERVTEEPPPKSHATRLDPRPRNYRALLKVARAAIIVAAALGLTLWYFMRANDVVVTISPPAHRSPSIAVLPFDDMSENQDQEYFASGLSEELLNHLAQRPGLRVIARKSSFAFQNSNLTVPELADQLNVSHVLEGSVRKSGDQLRISAQLINGEDGSHLWSKSYDRTLQDIFDVQAEIAASVVRSIYSELVTTEAPRPVRARSTELDTYDAYLRAIFLFHKGTQEGSWQAIDILEKALEADPTSALALAAISTGLSQIAHGPSPHRDLYHRAKSAADKAVALDEALPEAHLAVALYKQYYDWDWTAAEISFKRSLELRPNQPLAWYHLAWLYELLDRREEAIAAGRQAVELDPMSNFFIGWLSYQYWVSGLLDDARELATKVLESNPTHPVAAQALAFVECDRGHFEEAIELARIASQSDYFGWTLPIVRVLAGQPEMARKTLSEWEPLDHNALAFVQVYSVLRDLDQAYAWMRRARDGGSSWYPWALGYVPYMRHVLDDPRIVELAREVGTPTRYQSRYVIP
ncbi:MAG: winged helix-turn-helix domain-containing protein [Lysobacterales bacterium]|jgi:TolB-like protein/DNA-binding winged helix-turn-helix (wHTH) protein